MTPRFVRLFEFQTTNEIVLANSFSDQPDNNNVLSFEKFNWRDKYRFPFSFAGFGCRASVIQQLAQGQPGQPERSKLDRKVPKGCKRRVVIAAIVGYVQPGTRI